MCFCELECPEEKLAHYLICEGHSEDLYNQNLLLVRLHSNLVWYYNISRPVEKKSITVFKVSEDSKCQ